MAWRQRGHAGTLPSQTEQCFALTARKCPVSQFELLEKPKEWVISKQQHEFPMVLEAKQAKIRVPAFDKPGE